MDSKWQGFFKSGGKYDISCFGEQLKQLRIYRGHKYQATVGEKLNISRQVFSLWESGKRYPSLEQLQEIANYFEIDINYFFLPIAECEEFDLRK